MNELELCRRHLTKIATNPKETVAEREVASFYLKALEPYNEKYLHRQPGYHLHLGGTGDNIVNMPVIERDEKGPLRDESGQYKKTYCVFDDFQGYLDFIQKKSCVRYVSYHWHHLPASVNGLLSDEYMAIWNRAQQRT